MAIYLVFVTIFFSVSMFLTLPVMSGDLRTKLECSKFQFHIPPNHLTNQLSIWQIGKKNIDRTLIIYLTVTLTQGYQGQSENWANLCLYLKT